jgi:hypothetical protein
MRSDGSQELEDLLKAPDLTFGLVRVLFERRAELIGIRGLRHLGQGLKNMLFGVVDVFQRV